MLFLVGWGLIEIWLFEFFWWGKYDMKIGFLQPSNVRNQSFLVEKREKNRLQWFLCNLCFWFGAKNPDPLFGRVACVEATYQMLSNQGSHLSGKIIILHQPLTDLK